MHTEKEVTQFCQEKRKEEKRREKETMNLACFKPTYTPYDSVKTSCKNTDMQNLKYLLCERC